MRIGLTDIDAHIAQLVGERLCAPISTFLLEPIHWGGVFPFRFNWNATAGKARLQRKRDPNEDERRAIEIRKKREEQFGLRVAGTVFGPFWAGFGLAVGAHTGGAPDVLAMGVGAATWAAGTGIGAWWARKAAPRNRLEQSLQFEEMRAVFPLLSLSRAERTYCDALLMLSRVDCDVETERTMRETLRQLNDLLRSSRDMENRRQSLLPILGLNSIPQLEREFGELGQRLDRANDPILRESLQQSLQMCASRLENARLLEQGLERLNAQQEAIGQTLASALSAIARMQAAPNVRAETVVAQEIAATVTQMNQQTYAVEKAVEEVITLGG